MFVSRAAYKGYPPVIGGRYESTLPDDFVKNAVPAKTLVNLVVDDLIPADLKEKVTVKTLPEEITKAIIGKLNIETSKTLLNCI